ncbi:MAG TPA: TIGR03621 family F420-dependent LLM class oxidoreductase [Acidimicrobiia bacterium]|jgi:probable F420-dependent oxidoreductase|nr:TIGR03621 family F420-dependent LLM class oxidoreductase [Acidimicrobiia bacterium]
MPHDRKFRFGVMAPRAESARQYRENARKWETLGYSTLFVPDHFVDHPLAPIPAMAMVAEATTTLRVGALVLGNDYKHPVVLAREAATLDLLSDGRLELGLGAGWMTVDYEKAGLALDPPGVRVDRLAESIAVVKGLFADGEFSFDGKHYQISDLDGGPRPVQRPIPILVGGGAKRVLSLAAQEADIVGINANLRRGQAEHPDAAQSLSAAATDQKLAWVRDAAGARFADLEIQQYAGFVHFTDDRESLAAAMAPAFDVTPEVALETPIAIVGTVEQMIEDLLARRERWQMSYVVVDDAVAEPFAPVVERLAGT